MNSTVEPLGDDELMLTVAEVARQLRVSKMTVYRWVHSGEIGASRFGNIYRIPHSAVHKYRESHRIPNQREGK
ncbi:MAG TPA: helix-turn-helix domain-containing protein [Pseudonocardia sp.]|uniref:helix-turn-helix domain-containing protein n=1 Tax=Pseudonocardia sp. TaxID=60912 RepID=UPI002C2377E3|nr:helix-turn-helix domain-containing protein [Pseudonocardia sp.]HTF49440.1 helix-turn-helix domain-containing protein [Pseudonocardia sp.]